MSPIENLKTFPSKSYTNVTGRERILFVDPKDAKKGTTPPVNYIELETISNLVLPGPTGPQGPIGPQGVPGPVGPAGLNWQGAWDATTSYVIDDAVGFGGASWFCIANIAGNPSNDDPSVDTVSWALLAAQGATGPQGPQGIQGPAGSSVQTSGGVGTTPSQTDPSNVLIYDRNNVTGITNRFVRLPDNAPIGKEVIVQYGGASAGDFVNILAFDLGTKISVNQSNGNSSSYQLFAYETIRFISRGSNFWIAEYIIGTNISFNYTRIPSFTNSILETIVNNTTSALSLATLNSTYSQSALGLPVPPGLKVYCPNIVGGGLVYIKTGGLTWVSAPITVVV